MDSAWFEMADLKKHSYGKATWVPLCSYSILVSEGQYGFSGYIEEYFGAFAIRIKSSLKDQAMKIQWMEASGVENNGPWVSEVGYVEAGSFSSYTTKIQGKYLVLQQTFETGEIKKWHLDQDLVLGLGLLREGDIWRCPKDDYIDVVRLKRDSEGFPRLIEIRAEHLRDYLNARESGLIIARYHSRREIAESFEQITWPKGQKLEKVDSYRWEGRLIEIHEGGTPYGAETAVIHASYKNIDYQEDVPRFDYSLEENVESKKWSVRDKRPKLVHVISELWKNDWVEPGPSSPRIRGDEVESTISFIVNNDGKTASGEALKEEGRYLWFKPTVITALADRRNSVLYWYTGETGSVGAVRNYNVHFGVNDIGLINVYAKDIASLPEAHQKIWVAHNVSPEGGVSKELLMAQMEVKPAGTVAPEITFHKNSQQLDSQFETIYGKRLFREHADSKIILSKIHRFHSVDMEGLFKLAKLITKMLTERIDIDLLKQIRPKEDKRLGSLKRLERLLSEKGADGRKIMGPLVGIYELRLADAHLSSEDLKDALKLVGIELVGIDKKENFPSMGKRVIQSASETLLNIAQAIR